MEFHGGFSHGQGAPFFLACWVGIPVYLILTVSNNYDRLKYNSKELLSPLLTGLESQFIYSNVNSKLYNYHRLKIQSRELLSPLLAGLESLSLSSFISK